MQLGGRALFLWAVDALREAGCSPLILVVPADLVDLARAEAPTDVRIVQGGPTRQASVWNGLQLVTTDVVVVHDAARPLVTPALVRDVIAAVDDAADAVVAAVPVDETLKLVPNESVVERTVDRSLLWRSQTPAAFRTRTLREAHEKAHAEGFVGTDESQLVERAGGKIKVVRGTRDNLKVTFAEDFAIAEAMLEARHR